MSIEYAQHQKDAIAFQSVHPFSICAMQTGTGKSATTIGSELVNLHQDKLDKCIFVCTKGSIGEVKNDYHKFYNFTPFELDSKEALYEFFNSDKTIAVTRYEWLKYFDKSFLETHVKDKRLGIWWDEAQRLKNGSRDTKQESGTKAHKMSKLLRPYCDVFHLVTATPIMTSLDDLWSLMHLVNPDLLTYDQFADNFYVRELVVHPKYKKRLRHICPTCGCAMEFIEGWNICSNPYCKSVQTPNGFVPFREKVRCIWELVEYKNLDILSKMLQPYMFCFFPEQDIRYVLHNVELDEDTDRKYLAIAKDTLNKLDNNIPTPFATRMIELQYLVDRCYNKKLELWNLANQLKSKGFVLYVSLYDTEGLNSTISTLDHVKAVLDKVEGLEYRAYSGKEKDDERDENKKWFQEDPTNKCLIITEAGGASLNLQVTNEFIFYNLPAGFGKMSQAFGRVVRLFSTFKSFNIHFILAEHSVDSYKYAGFLMYEEVMKKLLNNKLINTKAPMSFNAKMKMELRQDLLWRQEVYNKYE